jgi:Rrf2 family protein
MVHVRISAKTDYAIRAGAELATRSEGWVKTEFIAQAQGIPLPFLLNILGELRTAGIVRSRRGVDGGYQLARPASEVSVADVIRAVDGPLANVAGALPEDVAYQGAATALRDVWVALRVTMRSVLEEVSLAQLAASQLPSQVSDLTAEEGAWQARSLTVIQQSRS